MRTSPPHYRNFHDTDPKCNVVSSSQIRSSYLTNVLFDDDLCHMFRQNIFQQKPTDRTDCFDFVLLILEFQCPQKIQSTHVFNLQRSHSPVLFSISSRYYPSIQRNQQENKHNHAECGFEKNAGTIQTIIISYETRDIGIVGVSDIDNHRHYH